MIAPSLNPKSTGSATQSDVRNQPGASERPAAMKRAGSSGGRGENVAGNFATRSVGHYPVVAVVTATAIGVALGWLIKRRLH